MILFFKRIVVTFYEMAWLTKPKETRFAFRLGILLGLHLCRYRFFALHFCNYQTVYPTK
jgi:hypothetical protein